MLARFSFLLAYLLLCVAASPSGYYARRNIFGIGDNDQAPPPDEEEVDPIDELDDGVDHYAAVDDSDYEGPRAGLPALTNSSLGFAKLLYLNVPYRYDLDDTITMQSIISGIRPERFVGVTRDDISAPLDPAAEPLPVPPLKTDGLAPSSSNYRFFTPGIAACYRSHANIWRTMLENNWPTLLVLEGDAAWDSQIRRLMPHFSLGLEDLLYKLGKLNETEVVADDGTVTRVRPVQASVADPYLANHWDYINFGGCYSNRKRMEQSYQYYDPYAPVATEESPLSFFGKPIKSQRRVVRYRAEEACTGAYALTRSGALKLLLATAADMSRPVDLAIRGMIAHDKLEAFSVFPILFNQGQYRRDLGTQVKGSETGMKKQKAKADAEPVTPWDEIHESMNVWRFGIPGLSRFKNDMLFTLKDYIFTRTKARVDGDLGGRL